MTHWTKEADNGTHIVWRSKKMDKITVEAHRLVTEIPGSEQMWYIYTAVGGYMTQSSPRKSSGKGKAIRVIALLKKMFDEYATDALE